MSRNKIIHSILVFTLLFQSQNVSIASAASCTTLGETKIKNGVKFTCIPYGDIGIWRSGVSVEKSNESIPVLPLFEVNQKCKPRGSKALIGKHIYICKKFGKRSVWRKTKVSTDKDTPTQTRQEVIFTPWATKFETTLMTQTALNATSSFFGNVTPSSDYEITIDPQITNSDRIWITSALDYATGLFTLIQKEKMKVFLGTSHTWSRKAVTAANLWIGDPNSTYPCSQGINDAYCADKNLVLLIYSDIYAPNSQYRWDFGRRSTPAHEVFHTVQFALTGPNVPGNNPMHIPRWLMEGSANYFGFYVADRLGFDNYQTGRNQQVNANPAYKTVAPLIQYDNFNSDPYGIGQAASEYLIASVGFEKFLNIWRFTKSESSFSEGFKKAVGITIEDFYSKFEAARGSMQIGS